MKGLYLNTPPKPKQAKVVELQEAEGRELEVDGSLEEETQIKVEKGGSDEEAATRRRPGRSGRQSCSVRMVTGAGPGGAAMELEQHSQGP